MVPFTRITTPRRDGEPPEIREAPGGEEESEVSAVGRAATGITECFVILHVRYWEENNQWLGDCVELGTATFADAFEDVRRELREMIDLHLNTLEETGEREAFFKEHKIKVFADGQVTKGGKWSMAQEVLDVPDETLTATIRVPVPA